MKKILSILTLSSLITTSAISLKPLFINNTNLNTKTNLKIINGNIVKNFQDYPYMAALCLNNDKSLYNSHEGGATFISQNFLLTAAHLITDFTDKNLKIINPNAIRVAYGGLNLKTDNFNVFKVKNIYRIPNFTANITNFNIDNDLAIIEIQPHPKLIVDTVKLYNQDEPNYLTDIGQEVRALGWGAYLKKFGPVIQSPQLRYGDSIIKSSNDIRNYLHNNCLKQFWKVYKPNDVFGVKAINCKNVNHGDSGGPLLSYDKKTKKYIEIGIASWIPYLNQGGFPKYTFFVNLTNPIYQNWINSIITIK